MRNRPEKLAQEFFGVFAAATLARHGAAIREGVSGIGFVDVLLTFSSGLVHVIELKILRANAIPGPAQIANYMQNRNRKEGWLVLFDSRKPDERQPIPDNFPLAAGVVRTVSVDINPRQPSRL